MSHVKFGFHSNLDTLTYFTAKNRSKLFVCIHGLSNLYRGPRYGTHTEIVSALTPTDFRHAWAIFGPLVDKNTGKGELMELPASKKFYSLFSTCFEIWIWNLVYTSSRWHDTWGLSFITIRSMPLERFLDFFLNVLRYLLQSWLIHSVGCTTYWVMFHQNGVPVTFFMLLA